MFDPFNPVDPASANLTPYSRTYPSHDAKSRAKCNEGDRAGKRRGLAARPLRFDQGLIDDRSMWQVSLGTVRRVLCLGAHSDDIEIGIGGTLLHLIEQVPDLEIYWVVFSAPGARTEEACRSADDFLVGVARKHVEIGSFRESYFPSEWPVIKDWVERIKGKFDPDVVFTHYRDDRHQDHRVLSDLAWNTFRNHLILEYEILKYDGDLGHPGVFVPLPERLCNRKIELLLKHFQTQRSKHWFTRDTFEAMHRIRGIECASPSGRAEAFYCRKLVFN